MNLRILGTFPWCKQQHDASFFIWRSDWNVWQKLSPDLLLDYLLASWRPCIASTHHLTTGYYRCPLNMQKKEFNVVGPSKVNLWAKFYSPDKKGNEGLVGEMAQNWSLKWSSVMSGGPVGSSRGAQSDQMGFLLVDLMGNHQHAINLGKYRKVKRAFKARARLRLIV